MKTEDNSPLKVLFIVPPYFNIEDFFNSKSDRPIPVFTIPYGILSLESYMKAYSKKGVSIELLDLNKEGYRTAKEKLDMSTFRQDLMRIVSDKLKGRFDIVGISALFNNSYEYLKELSDTIKMTPGHPLCVVGGGLASNLYQKVLEDFPSIDGVCLSEGEIPMLDLINSNDFSQTLEEHRSWITRKSMKKGKIPMPSYVENLDDIPMFDYTLIKLKDYNGRALDKRYCNDRNKVEISIHTSRGCPFNCVFCANSSVHGKKVRYMSEERVIAEIDHMIKDFGMNVLLIEDDHFLSNKERVIKILNEVIKRDIRIEFPNGIAVHAIDDDIGNILKQAGTTAIQLAVESCSDYVLRNIISKPHNVAQIKKAKDILQKNGILVHAFIVIGLPGEMDEHRKESFRMIKEIGFDWVYFFTAIPIVGSRLYKICAENNYLVDNSFSKHIASKGSIRAPGVDPDKIEKTAYDMNLEVNFIDNANVSAGRYDQALPYFTHISNKYPDHALTQYVLANIYKQQNELGLYSKHHRNYLDILAKSNEWRSYALEHNL